jgi:hypothetical protein
MPGGVAGVVGECPTPLCRFQLPPPREPAWAGEDLKMDEMVITEAKSS